MSVLRRNNVKMFGNGERTLMFAHGYGCDQNMWRRMISAFEDQYRIILFDYVGAGNSDPSAFDRTRYSSLNGYARDVIEILEELNPGPVSFVGHSVSSMIGALAAIERPELFDSLIMIGPSPRYINDAEYEGGFARADIEGLLEMLERNHMGWSSMMAPVIMGHPEEPELAAELEASLCRTNPVFAQHFARVTFLSDNRLDLPKVATRTLILQCDKDVIAPPTVGEYVHRCVPNSQLVMMQAKGHCPHVSSPAEVIEIIKQISLDGGGDPLKDAGLGAVLAEHAPVGCLVLKVDGAVIGANRAFFELSGWAPPLPSGWRFQQALSAAGAIFVEAHVFPVLLLRGALNELALDLIRPNGERVPVLVNARLVQQEKDASPKVVLALMEMKERRQFESELLEARKGAEQIAEIVRRSADAILTISPEAKIQSWNRGAEQMFGYGRDEALSQPFVEMLFGAEDREEIRRAIQLVAAGQEVTKDFRGPFP